MKRKMLIVLFATLASVSASPYSKISDDDAYGQRIQKNPVVGNAYGQTFAASSASAHAGAYTSSHGFASATAHANANANAAANADAYSGSNDQGYEQQADYGHKGSDGQTQYHVSQQTENTHGSNAASGSGSHAAGGSGQKGSQYWWMNNNSPFDGHKSNANTNYNSASATSGSTSSGSAHFGSNPFLSNSGSSGSSSQNYHGSSSGSHGTNAGHSNTASSGHKFDGSKNPFFGKTNSQAHAGATASATASGHGSNVPPSKDIQLPHVSTASKNVFLDQSINQQESGNGLSVTCSGEARICVPKHLCNDGYVSASVQGLSQVRSDVQQCDVNREVCCTLSATQHQNQDHHHQDQVPAGSYDDYRKTSESAGVYGSSQSQINVNVNDYNSRDKVTGGLFDTKYQQSELSNSFGSKPLVGDTLNGYLPPDHSGNPSDPKPDFIKPQDPEEPTGPGPIPTHVQLGCAAALICVEENLCGMDGMINPSPLSLTEEQITRRVPLSDCKNPDNGVIGKCCRDPNYVDPWPTGNLPANYSGGFDDQGFPTFLNIQKAKPTKKPTPTPVKGRVPNKNVQAPTQNAIPQQPKPQFPVPANPQPNFNVNANNGQPLVNYPNVPNFPTFPKPFNKNNFVESPSNANPVVIPPQVSSSCGVKNSVQRPSNLKEEEVGFGEIPWEAMVLYTPEKKLLCSGAFVAPNAVLTAARCLDGYQPQDISVKAGEWKLGYELKHEEPLPFEIVKVASIVPHPGYLPGSSAHDVAVLYLEHDVHLDRHVGTICLQDQSQQSYVPQGAKCISTGWGKHILQAHLAGAIMHSVQVDAIEENECRQRISNAEEQIEVDDSLVCVKPHQQRNNMCQVDLGGPLACERSDGTYEIVGVYTQDTGCLPTNQVATFALIDVPWVKYMLQSPPQIQTQPEPYPPAQQPQQPYEPVQPQQPQQPYAPAQQPKPYAPAQKPEPYAPAQQPQQPYAPAQQPKPYAPAQKPEPYAPAQQPKPYTPTQPKPYTPTQPKPYTPTQPKPYAPVQKPEPYAPAQQPEPYEPVQKPEPYAPAQQPEPYEPAQQPEPYEPAQQPEPFVPAQQPEPYAPAPSQPRPYKPAHLPFVPAQKPRPFAPADSQQPQPSQQPYYYEKQNNQPCDCQQSNLPPYDNQYLPPV
ncbi:uncharacterized protein LOC130672649 isoform X2 [Microplitis mediator]|uniref:uncharacterized protein LOC130672649 isoform X2 n=1 Tax=Microplitis mediator TaxID=375433 RepID=UPI002556EC50|nr:uncharacterized protein LOC130672649 isoform X2 [Microplitis mediator]